MSLIMFKKYQGKFFCFSPPVMLATLLIEFSSAAYTLWRYKVSTIQRLSVALLISLGTFQLAEYMICGGLGLTHIEWAQLGYGAITLLPALGMHAIVTLADKKKPLLVGAAYASCIGFLAANIIGTSSFVAHECAANYAVFNISDGSLYLYMAYYYGWLAIGTVLAIYWGSQMPARRKALQSMAFGYAAFVLPTIAFNILEPTSTRAIPSVMCGFAVIFAITIVYAILPNSSEVRVSTDSTSERFQIGF